jgi:hypothetical protein
MKKKVMLMALMVLILMPVAVFGISSSINANEESALLERLQWEESNNEKNHVKTTLSAYQQEQDGICNTESLNALAERIQWEEKNNTQIERSDYLTIESNNILCVVAHSWGSWSSWYQWGIIRHHPTQCRTLGVFCHREEERHRVCSRCNNMQTESRMNTQFQCII